MQVSNHSLPIRQEAPMKRSASTGWTFAIVSIALFMVVLDNLVVTNALPSIKRELGATIQQLEWTVNAYTLSYAVLGPIAAGAVFLAAFVAWELRAAEPMLPMTFFKSRAFSATNGVSIAMYF